MKKFLDVYLSILARERVMLAFHSINHQGSGIENSLNKVWLPGKLEEIVLIEVKVALLAAQIEILRILTRNSIDFWEDSNMDFREDLETQLSSPLFHRVMISEKEFNSLMRIDPLDIYNPKLHDYYQVISQLAGINSKRKIDEETSRDFVVRAISFNSYLEKIRATSAYDKKSVVALYEMLISEE